jgi:hypothetical protein
MQNYINWTNNTQCTTNHTKHMQPLIQNEVC